MQLNEPVKYVNLLRKCHNENHPLHGKHLVASAYGWTPYVVVDEYFNIQGGVAVEIFRTAAEYYKFSYDLMYDEGWYSFFENGTIGGSFGSVIQNTCINTYS